MKKNIFMVIVLILVLAMLSYVGYGFYQKITEKVQNPIVTMEIENYGTIKMELYPNFAPNTVKNFVTLVQNGFYDGKTFFGIDTNAVYAGRNAEGEIENAKLSNIGQSGDSDYEYQIKGEFVANQFDQNTLRHEKGVVSMARNDYSQYMSNLTQQSYDSANSQFSILLNDERGYNGLYAAFGKVTEGLEIIESFKDLEKKTDETEEEAEVTESSLENFAQMPKITKATVETFGVDYGSPEVEEAFDYQNYLYNYYSQQYNQ